MGFRYIFMALTIGWGCTGPSKESRHTFNNTELLTVDSLFRKAEEVFESHKLNGCFILSDVENGSLFVYNSERSEEQFLPASTFKILNSLIALECGAVKSVDEVIAWDSVRRFLPDWNKDHSMRSGIKYSTVWFFQELARRIGPECMEKWVDSVSYGNGQTGPVIDEFWLTGDLRITPREQVDFLNKLVKNELPFHPRHIQAVKEILIEDRNENYIFRAKTGWSDFGREIGWYVGYIEIRGHTYGFVNNIDIDKPEDGRARKEIVKEMLDFIFALNLKI